MKTSVPKAGQKNSPKPPKTQGNKSASPKVPAETPAASPDDLVDRLENHIQKWRFIVEGSRDDNLDAIWAFGSDLLSEWDKLRKEVHLKLGRTITRRSVEPTKEGA